ncbi:MAG: glycoside hydrolase family 2 TIM barrel-domain containing protein [Crocinitomicaceae bacterium]
MEKQIILLFLAFMSLMNGNYFGQTSKVTVQKINDQWELLVDGKPFYIKGAGGETHLDKVVESGANTIRTWGLENAQEVLDAAQAKGLKVMLGMWVQHERHGFDYNDEEKIKNQLNNFRVAVEKYKNHPALLLWGVGNEYELDYSNTKVWSAVNDIAKMVKELDPNHPTSTVTAGTSPSKVKFINETMTAIDIYGINTYGDIENVKKVLKDGNFNGPYMITEWGPNGHWESPKTRWGSSIEQTSTEKALTYKTRYQDYIWGERKQCIGSFAFLWGQKQEYTSTWYGVFDEEGRPTEAIDALEYDWSGKYPVNRSPSIDSVLVEGVRNYPRNLILTSGQSMLCQVFSIDLNKDKLSYTWELYPESTDLKTGGDREDKPTAISGKLKNRNQATVKVKAPNTEGRYRLFVTVSDGEKIAYMNIPFYVQENLDADGNSKKIIFTPQDLKSFEEK